MKILSSAEKSRSVKAKWFVNGDLQWLILLRVSKSSTKKDDDQDDEDESRDLFQWFFFVSEKLCLSRCYLG